MTDAKKPMAEANRISSMLNTVLGADRFPVKVDELALEYSRQCFADSPIDTVRGEDLDGFDGLLKANKARADALFAPGDHGRHAAADRALSRLDACERARPRPAAAMGTTRCAITAPRAAALPRRRASAR